MGRAGPARAWPLVGRTDELQAIAAALRQPAEMAPGVVLAGAPGVGKTRLAREALGWPRRRATPVRWAYGTASARGTPLGAFAGLLDHTVTDPAQLIRQGIDALTRGAATAPAVVAVDDAHLLDELSAHLVHQLVVRRGAPVVLTVRSGQPAPDAVTALWKDDHLRRLEVHPLSEAATTALLRTVLDGPVDSTGAGRLWSLTRGNTLFLRHLVDAELEAGRLHQVDGVWVWPQHPVVPPEVVEIIGAQFGDLPDAVGEVVDLLALGEPLDLDLLTRLTDRPAVEQAEARGLLVLDADGQHLQARLGHPLYGEVRRSELGPLRARRLRGLLVTALAGTRDRGQGDTVRRAVLALDSDLPPDPTLFVEAAHGAVRLFDLALGERLARAAVDAGGGAEAELTLAYALSWLSEGAAAEEVLARLLTRLGAATHDDADRVRVAIPRAANLFWSVRDADTAEAVLADALSVVRDETARAALTAMRAAFHAALGRPREAVDTGSEALATPSLGDQGVVLAASGVVAAAAVLGDMEAVRRTAPLGYDAAARSFDAGVLRFGLSDFHILAVRLAGDVREAESIAADRRADSADVPGPAQVMGLVLLGQAALAAGKLQTAARWLREARAGLRTMPTHEFSFRCRLHLTQALAMAGDAAGAGELLVELEAERHPAFTITEPDAVLARAWVAAAEGAVTEALSVAREAAELARGRDAPAYEVLALQTAVCFGDHTVSGRLAELATVVQGPRARTAAAHATALAAADGDALVAASAEWERVGDPLVAADAAAQAATAFAHHGRRGSAISAAARARRLADTCEGARTPALVAAARPLPLTTREREIVTLAAAGLTNREIAARLVVSVRTVEGHLYRIGNKLGVSRRGELAAVLGTGPHSPTGTPTTVE